ncbi:Tubulin-tyrosine ligase family protein [Tritrichomonas foetus]|uniref:Tubulin-tyrosine ligase family protein n=1 Tax=Tritrichomonas foetus TaxID=1144522 RepID=A0A1J4KTQ9_9EUKA|nr:Tubulin-tyrosine ligase family protein [Tritrichomonas foetus]|eukprot:OHT13046.1 Tubulin-tyrosine ligase family protein [Tritrichomonas foetus]
MSDQDQTQAPPEPISYEEWYEIHKEIFDDYGFPGEQLGKLLYQKLMDENRDAGEYFSIDAGDDPTLIYTPHENHPPLTAYSNVFLSDHCWCCDALNIVKEWKKNTELRERLAPYSENPDPPSPPPLSLNERLEKCDGKNLDLDELEITQLQPLRIAERFPELESLSLWGNELSDVADLLTTLASLKNLRGLWIKSNPVNDAPGISESILACCKSLEIFNSNFTKNYGVWALSFVAHNSDPRSVAILDLSDREITEIRPEAFKPFSNIAKIDFTGNDVDLSHILDVCPTLKSIKCDHPEQLPESIVFVNDVDRQTGDFSMRIPDRIWDHIQPAGDVWGICDEVGLSIHHSYDPNFAMMPCGSPKSAFTFCAFWPISDIAPNTEVTANLYPRLPYAPIEPEEPLTPMISLKSKFASTVISKRPIKVWTDIINFAENFHSDKFEVVETPAEADIQWWGLKDINVGERLLETKGVYYNQIQNEKHITCKDLLYETCLEYMGPVPWLPETFILSEGEQVAKFLETHRKLKESNQSPAWVVKAFNRSRAEYMLVTESPSEVLRHSSIEPRLTQRYLWNPLLIFGLKFDLRYIVLLKSVKPMELYMYKVFWPRLAPKRWALDDFDDYERHFTVMNYRAPDKVTHKTYVDFVEQFEIENPNMKWDTMQQRLYNAIRDMFICGCQKMIPNPYTKAMYGIDCMITNDYQPVILECNFQPDCKRACNLCPTFVDDVFEVLYTDQPVTNDKVVQLKLPE